MVEDAELRKVECMMWHLTQVKKTFKVEKLKGARDLLLYLALDAGSRCIKAAQKFRDDPEVLNTFRSEATRLLQGHTSRATYNVCLGLLAARFMYGECLTFHTFLQYVLFCTQQCAVPECNHRHEQR